MNESEGKLYFILLPIAKTASREAPIHGGIDNLGGMDMLSMARAIRDQDS
jgi:hypothetical protein